MNLKRCDFCGTESRKMGIVQVPISKKDREEEVVNPYDSITSFSALLYGTSTEKTKNYDICESCIQNNLMRLRELYMRRNEILDGAFK